MQTAAQPPPWLAGGSAAVASHSRLLKLVLPEVHAMLDVESAGGAAREWDDLPELLAEHLDARLTAMAWLGNPAGRRQLVGAQQRWAWARLATHRAKGKPPTPRHATLSPDLVEAVGKQCGDATAEVADRESGFAPAAWLCSNLREPERFAKRALQLLSERLLRGLVDRGPEFHLEFEIELLETLERCAVPEQARALLRTMGELVFDVRKSYKLERKYKKWRARDPMNGPIADIEIDVAVVDRDVWPKHALRPKGAAMTVPATALPDELVRCMDSFSRYFSGRAAKEGQQHIPDSRIVPRPSEGCPPPVGAGSPKAYRLVGATLVLASAANSAADSSMVQTEWLLVFCRSLVHPTYREFSAVREFKHCVVDASLAQHAVLNLWNTHDALPLTRMSELLGVERSRCESLVDVLSRKFKMLKKRKRLPDADPEAEDLYEPHPLFARSLVDKKSSKKQKRVKRVTKLPLYHGPRRPKPQPGGPTSPSGSGGLTPTPPTRDYFAKSETGFCGLSNQGATCYLNSLLQSLYMTPEFKASLYSWEYDERADGDKAECVPFQLQKLFASMDTSPDKAVSTAALTRSFGWDVRESFVQHDVQELCRVLFDALETTVGGTSQSNMITDIYQGQMTDYVQCKHCQFQSTRCDKFLDLQLSLRDAVDATKQVKSVEEGLRNFFAPETLDGDNKWSGCQRCQTGREARKGLRLDRLPYILTLQLKRFDFDYATNARVKLTGEVSFPHTLNMDEFMTDHPADAHAAPEPAADGSPRAPQGMEYQLFGILVHAGNARFGHYYAYILDFATNQWLEFNDSSVSRLPAAETRRAFGSATSSMLGSAYMLIYRRVDATKNQAPKRWTVDDLPPAIAEELKREKQEADEKKKQEDIEKDLRHVRVYSADGQAALLTVSRTTTVRELSVKALETIGPDAGDASLQTRMRRFNETAGIFEAVLGDDETVNDHAPLPGAFWIETRKEDSMWDSDHSVDTRFGVDGARGRSACIHFKVYSYDKGSSELHSRPMVLQFAEKATRADLFRAVAGALQQPPERLCRWLRMPMPGAKLDQLATGSPEELLQGPSSMMLTDGTMLFVEVGESPPPPDFVPLAGEEITATVKTVKGKAAGIRIGLDNTILDLKCLYQQAEGLPVAEQRLVFRGKEVADGEYVSTIRSVEVPEAMRDTLFVVVKRTDLTALPVHPNLLATCRMAEVFFTAVDEHQPSTNLKVRHRLAEPFDTDRPLKELKQLIGDELGVDPVSFAVHCNEMNRCDELSLLEVAVQNQIRMIGMMRMPFARLRFVLTLKKCLQPTVVHRCRVFLHRPGQPLLFLFDDEVNETLTGAQYKEAVAPRLRDLAAAAGTLGRQIEAEMTESSWAELASVTPQTLRLREPGLSVVRDDPTLVESFGVFAANQRIAVQVLPGPEPKQSVDQAVVSVYQWRPELFALDDTPSELLVDAKWTVAQLRAALAEHCFDAGVGISADDVGVAQHGDGSGSPPPWLDIPEMDWDRDRAGPSPEPEPSTAEGAAAGGGAADGAPAAATGDGPTAVASTMGGPHYFARDEKVFLCRDNRAQLRELQPEERAKLEQAKASAAAAKERPAASAPAERGLKIRIRKRAQADGPENPAGKPKTESGDALPQ